MLSLATHKCIRCCHSIHWRLYMQAGWSQDPDLQKMAYIHLPKKKKKLYVKLTYCDRPNKNVEHLDLRITKSWVRQK